MQRFFSEQKPKIDTTFQPLDFKVVTGNSDDQFYEMLGKCWHIVRIYLLPEIDEIAHIAFLSPQIADLWCQDSHLSNLLRNIAHVNQLTKEIETAISQIDAEIFRMDRRDELKKDTFRCISFLTALLLIIFGSINLHASNDYHSNLLGCESTYNTTFCYEQRQLQKKSNDIGSGLMVPGLILMVYTLMSLLVVRSQADDTRRPSPSLDSERYSFLSKKPSSDIPNSSVKNKICHLLKVDKKLLKEFSIENIKEVLATKKNSAQSWSDGRSRWFLINQLNKPFDQNSVDIKTHVEERLPEVAITIGNL